MKKRLMFCVGLVFALAACDKPSANFTGCITGVEGDTLLVYIDHLAERKLICTDTVPLVKNTFEFQVPDTASNIRFFVKPSSSNKIMRMFPGMPILFFPGDKLHMEGTADNYTVSGSELYDGLARFPEVRKLQAEVNDLNQAYSKAYHAKDEAEKTRIKSLVKVKYEQMQMAKFEIVKSNPNTVAAAYFATQLDPKRGIEAIGLLSDEIKKGHMAPVIQKSQQAYESSLLRDEAKNLIQSGKVAPDFNLTTLDGKEITLSTFKGKYLLVDFWGTWCGWCIKGIPAMKKAYEKHRANIEFLGVCCGDTDKKWRECVAHHSLPWVNALEKSSKLSARFAVSGYPTKVLIDPNGKIVEVFVGESPELYKKLDSLFGK